MRHLKDFGKREPKPETFWDEMAGYGVAMLILAICYAVCVRFIP